MSQLQVTGEAKVRDIQGPVVANSGVITALDGDASQYVRGDGTLADFPTSTGGGSSVSYYLNSSVSQGTIGGVAYRQLSKTPISGAGTDITASTNGYIASYLTDANDPALLEVPAGNFNCEFYFSVNSNNHNPYVYAELYKYDGTTFTLLGSNVAIPEYLTNGTTLSAYYFAIPVPVAALTITDRLAIRIYVNVDTRVVTLHTENNHLCQVVTTFSKGLTSLNNLTRQVQFLATGTSGTDFNIVSSLATHTFNIPDASATNRGLITTGAQTIAGAKVFDNPITANSGIGFLNGVMPNITSNLYSGIGGNSQGISIITRPVSTNYTNNFYFPSASNSYTFPNATGTIALTTDLSAYLPLSGGTMTGQIVLKESSSNTDFTKGLRFPNDPFGGSNDIAGLRLYNTFSENMVLELYTGNDGANDFINFATGVGGIANNNTVTINGNIIWNAGNLPSPQSAITLTTTGTSGAATFVGNTLNIPNYGSALSGYLPLTGGTLTGTLNGTSANFSNNVAIGGATSPPTAGLKVLGDIISENGIGVSNVEGGVAANYYGTYSGGSTPLSFLYGSTGSVTWNNGGVKMTLTSAGALQLVSSISATSATFNGNVGIKTSGRSESLSVEHTLGNNSAALIYTNGITSGQSYGLTIYAGTNASDRSFLVANQGGGTEYFKIRGDGYLQSPSTYNNTTASPNYLSISSSGFFERFVASSARYKEEIKDWDVNGLDIILALRPRTYKYKKEYYNKADVHFLGLIAEEVAEVNTYLADYENEDGTGQVENVRYATIVVPLIKAVQELKAQIEELSNKIVALESK
jgi:hypothetical protein